MGNGSDIFNPSDFHAISSKSSESRLTTRPGLFGTITTGGPYFDVQAIDPSLFALFCDIHRSKHRCVGRAFVAIGLHLHTTTHTRNSFPPTHISHVNKGIAERGENVANSPM